MASWRGWIALNLVMITMGRRPFDGPPFNELEFAVSLAALFMTVLILCTHPGKTAEMIIDSERLILFGVATQRLFAGVRTSSSRAGTR